VRTPADGRGGSTPSRPSAAGQPQQWFVLRPWLFDVTLANWLLRAAPRPARPLPVEPWARAYGLLPAPGGSPHTVSLIGPGPDFDPQYAMTTDLDKPVIIASVTADGTGQPYPLLINGCHRLYKAAVTGRPELPALVLTAAETLSIRHEAVLGPSAARRAAGRKARR
jgi:hypothetical protein